MYISENFDADNEYTNNMNISNQKFAQHPDHCFSDSSETHHTIFRKRKRF